MSNVIFPVFSQILRHWIPQCHCYCMLSVHFKLADDMVLMMCKHKICQFRLYFCETKLLANFYIHHEQFCAETTSFKLRYSCLCLVNSNNYFIFSFGGIPLHQKPNFIISEWQPMQRRIIISKDNTEVSIKERGPQETTVKRYKFLPLIWKNPYPNL